MLQCTIILDIRLLRAYIQVRMLQCSKKNSLYQET